MDWNAILWQAAWMVLKTLPQLVWACRYPLLLLGLLQLAKYALRVAERRRIAGSGIDEIDGMDGLAFEKYLETMFARLGYQVERTRYVGDYGADLVTRKDGVKMVIQGKRYKSKVGVKAVQEAVAAKGMYGCTAAMVVTNSTYTRQAVELARANGVVLWDRERLQEALLSLRPPEPERPADTAAVREPTPIPGAPTEPVLVTVSAFATPTPAGCATCGKVVSERVEAYCRAHRQRFNGQLYCYDHQRASRHCTLSRATDEG